MNDSSIISQLRSGKRALDRFRFFWSKNLTSLWRWRKEFFRLSSVRFGLWVGEKAHPTLSRVRIALDGADDFFGGGVSTTDNPFIRFRNIPKLAFPIFFLGIQFLYFDFFFFNITHARTRFGVGRHSWPEWHSKFEGGLRRKAWSKEKNSVWLMV